MITKHFFPGVKISGVNKQIEGKLKRSRGSIKQCLISWALFLLAVNAKQCFKLRSQLSRQKRKISFCL